MSYKAQSVIFVVFFISTLAIASVPVEVSDKYAHILINKTITFPGEESLGEVMYPTPNGDSYLVKVETDGPGATVETYRTIDLDRNDYSKMVSYGEVHGIWNKWFSFPSDYETGTVIFIRPPAYSSLRAKLEIVRYGTRTPEQRSELAGIIQIPLESLDKFYILPPFKVMVKPCGTVNAFSAPNITICTELIADIYQKDASEAISMIVLHEVGHTLLNLWNLPGWDNEDIVDEFAAVLLARARPQALKAMVKWLKAQDSLSAAAEQLSHGARHTVPVQRARNIERILNEVETLPDDRLSETEIRWFRLLGRYAR